MWKIISGIVLLHLVMFVNSQEYDETPKLKSCNKTLDLPSERFSLAVPDLSVGPCYWTIKPNKTTNETAITLFFEILYLHEDDEVTLIKRENETSSLIEPLRANNGSVTVVTQEKELIIKLSGPNKEYKRKFHGKYTSNCHVDISSPDIQLLHSPIIGGNFTDVDCVYTDNYNHEGILPVFLFEQFNFSSPNQVTVGGSKSTTGVHKNDPPMDFFPDQSKPLTIEVNMKFPTNDTFRLKKHLANENCTEYFEIDTAHGFTSPPNLLNNGTIIYECRWIFKTDGNKKLSVNFEDLYFNNALDIISINDGASEISPPAYQLTTSNRNSSMTRVIRTVGKFVWIAFKPVTFESKVSGKVTAHEQGGYFKGSGTISATKPETEKIIYQLEVESDEIVLLNFTSSKVNLPSKLNIYDGFDTSNLLATLQGSIWYPILSKSSKMMIIATISTGSSFEAKFKGVSPGCFHMSTLTDENYVLSGNCNSSCYWVIPPQNHPGSVLLLNLQFVSLGKADQIEINRLDNQMRIGVISANETHVPQLMLPTDAGALVEINRGSCEKDKGDVVLIGQSSYIPACGKNMTLETRSEFQLTSPFYPDTYPVYANCLWKLSMPKENIVHLAFNTLKLAPNHCVKVTHVSENKTEYFSGDQLPDDIFLTGESLLGFNSIDCKKSVLTDNLKSSLGFVVNGTVADCGAVLDKKKSGEFTVAANKSLCIWKIQVPETDNANDVNIISYTISKKDGKENYNLYVYDGASVRESIIKNNSLDTAIWSRTNNLIFIYKRIDTTKPSSILTFKYSTISCNGTMQCDNKLCLHPDWRCNGVNDCGDYSDERNCASVPIPPTIKYSGYSALAFWLTVIILFATGVFLGVTGPFCYQKYKNGQYRRFGDISVID